MALEFAVGCQDRVVFLDAFVVGMDGGFVLDQPFGVAGFRVKVSNEGYIGQAACSRFAVGSDVMTHQQSPVE